MTLRALCIPHGGGPLPLMDDPGHADLIAYLKEIENEIGRPEAIVVVSAHWEQPVPTITAHPNPDLYFDYYGFPPETYELAYPAPGSVELAERLYALLDNAGLDPALDTQRGFDHGMFVPLMLMYPDAKIPVVQVSLIDGLDPEAHIALGEAIRPVTEENVLVVGSGLSFHNTAAFRGDGPDEQNQAFDAWLDQACTDESIDESTRRSKLADWQSAPSAQYNHPREEHLIPLHVCYGVGGGAATRSFDGQVLAKRVGGYSWT